MSQSLSNIVVHIIFSTKNRQRFMGVDIQPRVHAYLATVCRDQGCHAYCVGGTHDHVHIATSLSRTLAVSKLVEKLKVSSSLWVKKQSESYREFHWQKGYGIFSVSPSNLDKLTAYIGNQVEHHKRLSFQDEYRRFLNEYEIQYDEAYVWD